MSGPKEELSRWFLSHHGLVLTIAFSCAPHPDLANDISQETFLEFLGEATLEMDELQRTNLLRRITKRIARRHWYERHRGGPEVIERIGQALARMTARVDENRTSYEHELYALRTCLSKLPDKSRRLVEQYYFMENTAAAIAEKLQVTPQAVFQAVYRIREKLRACIHQTLKKEGRHG